MENYKNDLNIKNATWKVLGPGGGGAMYIPTISPHDENTVLVACDMTGSYITHDGGDHWKQLSFKVWTGAFAFDPVNAGVIYAGATGLYRSEDNGDTWKLLFPNPANVLSEVVTGDHAEHAYVTNDSWPGGKIKAIVVDPTNSDHIFVGLNPGQRHAEGVNSDEVEIFYSTDRGLNWEKVLIVSCGAGYGSFIKLFIDPSSPQNNRRFYIFSDTAAYISSTEGFKLEKLDLEKITGVKCIYDISWGLNQETKTPVFYLLCPSQDSSEKFLSQVFRSIDGCKSWQSIEQGLSCDQVKGQSRKFTRITTSLNNSSIIYMNCCEQTVDNPNTTTSPFYFGIFKSEDGGNLWKWLLKISDENPHNRKLGWVEKDYATDWGGAPFNFGVGPMNPDICYTSDWGTTYKTIDGGVNWEQIYCVEHCDNTYTSRGLDVTNVNGVHFNPFNREHLTMTCTDTGLLESYNSGNSWKHSLKGVPSEWINSCYWMVYDPDVEGKAWSVWSNCHDLPRLKMFATGKLNSYSGGVCKSEDNLSTWKKSNSGMPENCAVTHIILDPQSPVGKRTLYIAGFGKGVFKSSNDGVSWEMKNKGISGNLNAWKLIILPDGKLYLLVARGFENGKSVDGSVYKSSDSAENWEKVTLPSVVNFPNDLCFDPENSRRLYMACWPEEKDGMEMGGGVYTSEDGGINWVSLFDDASYVYGITVDPDKTSTIFITTFEGCVYRSDDRGINWGRLGGYKFKWAKHPILDPHHKGMIYITTFGSSVWYGPDTGIENAFEDIYPIK